MLDPPTMVGAEKIELRQGPRVGVEHDVETHVTVAVESHLVAGRNQLVEYRVELSAV